MSNEKQIAKISPKELSLVEESALNPSQLAWVLKRTPKQYIKSRPAKGGGQWNYVSGSYVRKVLNLMFGFDWSFEILEQQVMHGEAIVKGKLTCHTNGKTIVKMQFGNKEIMCKKGTDIPLSIGNDLKAAATDALKKCAAELGIAADVYNAQEFREVIVDTSINNINENKERVRVLDHINSSTTINALMMVEGLIEQHGLEKEYFKKQTQLKNNG